MRRILGWRADWASNRTRAKGPSRESRYGAKLDRALRPPTFSCSTCPRSPPARRSASASIHRRRLREVYRSAGWPCQDGIEVELLAAGLLARERGPLGHETIRLTDAGLAVLAETLAKNRARRDVHEQLVERVAREMTRAGRLAWRGLAVRANVERGWTMAMPDVFSIRHTTVEAYAEPIVHEVKVQRADLLVDLRRASKREAYLGIGGECWYVLREGIASADEIPPECGVLVASDLRLEVVRPAPKRPTRIGFALWMALARATPLDGWRLDDAQLPLGADAADDCAGSERPTPR